MNKNKKWLAVLVAALMLAACMGCKAEIPPYLIVDGTTVVDYKDELPAKLVIPKGITKIAGGAFKRCDWLESVTIPNSVTEIGYDAFYDCTSLASVTIPNSVTEIGDSAFSGCTSLASVTIPNSVTKIGDWVLSGCTSLASVTIPNSVTEIGYNAFSGCDNIVVVTYNGTLKQWCQMDRKEGALIYNAKIIRLSDVENLKALTTLTIPNGVTKIGYNAFYGCDNIVVVTYNGTLKQWCQMDNNDYSLVYNAKIIRLSDVENLKALTTLTIPDGVTEIGDYAFDGCTSLASVTIPNSVTEIDYNAFSGCDNIVVVTYNGTLKQWCQMDNNDYYLVSNAKIIRLSDAENLKALTTLTIPNGVTKIGNKAFNDCYKLASVTIPNSVTEIGAWAFNDCYKLASVTIPNSVTKIDLAAFSGCTSLASVTYTGTKAQWEAVQKREWNYSVPATVVHCADGDAAL